MSCVCACVCGSYVHLPGMDQPPPTAMKRNPVTGEMEEFHSHKLQDDLVRHHHIMRHATPRHAATPMPPLVPPPSHAPRLLLPSPGSSSRLPDLLSLQPEMEEETAEVELPCGDDY